MKTLSKSDLRLHSEKTKRDLSGEFTYRIFSGITLDPVIHKHYSYEVKRQIEYSLMRNPAAPRYRIMAEMKDWYIVNFLYYEKI